jgi:hypothetical protein
MWHPLTVTGQMALTWYIGHILLGLGALVAFGVVVKNRRCEVVHEPGEGVFVAVEAGIADALEDASMEELVAAMTGALKHDEDRP